MALHFIIDGYNLLNRVAEWTLMPLEDGREALLKRIETLRPQGSRANTVTVVFDGQEDVGGPSAAVRPSGVRVVFSVRESADAWIKERISELPRKREVMVVTADRALAHYVRALGAGTEVPEAFWARAWRGRGRGGLDPSSGRAVERRLSKTREYEITRELREVWLERRRKRE